MFNYNQDIEEGTNQQTTTDYYGFEISVRMKDIEDKKKCEEKSRRRGERWMKHEVKRELPKDNKKLKQMIRKGIPPALRTWVWMEVSGAKNLMQQYDKDYYRTMVQNGRNSSKFSTQIELDLPRTFPGHAWIESPEGQNSLESVLLAYSVHNPIAGYCQSMNNIVAMLLLMMEKKEENVFWMLVTLIEEILYPQSYEHNLPGIHVEMRSLEDLLAIKIPKLASNLKDMGCDISIIATDWFLCLFANNLPSETVGRVWDCLFSEGPKILFRVAVAILLLEEKQLLNIDNSGDMLKAVKVFSRNMHNRDKLMKVAFDGIGSLSMTTIKRLRQLKKTEVDKMLEEREMFEKKRAQTNMTWEDRDHEESLGNDSDGRSSIATDMSGISVSWKDLR